MGPVALMGSEEGGFHTQGVHSSHRTQDGERPVGEQKIRREQVIISSFHLSLGEILLGAGPLPLRPSPDLTALEVGEK